ncbi:NH(3)-dependent NAD(+) synthetase [Mycobacteroides abscessus subsp. abscessus]|nr:NH(3)-dependent NAD(+) synthetase [Mycobacteroides abscessus subsp. abscessus]
MSTHDAVQDEIRSTLGVRPEIDPATEVKKRVDFLVDYVLTTGVRGLVLGISGGQDSTLAGRLCQLAVEDLRRRGADAEFWAVRLPYRVQADESDAQDALRFIDADHEVVFNIGAGTDHAAEAVTGFFTKFGDGAADVIPLSGLSKRQGRALLRHLGAPEHLTTKTPTADLLDEAPGQTDESSLGLTYEQIDDFLEGREVDDAVATTIIERYRATEHKRRTPVTPTDDWWIRH